jgi:hypothetical protein
MDSKLVSLLAVDLFLRQTVVEASVVKAPVAQAIPLAARLCIELKAIVLFCMSMGSYLPDLEVCTHIHILPKLIYLMLEHLSEIIASKVHLFQGPIQSHPCSSSDQLCRIDCSLRGKVIQSSQLVVCAP